MPASDTVERKRTEGKRSSALGNDLVKIKKAEAKTAQRIETMEKRMESDIKETTNTLNEKMKAEIERERLNIIRRDKTLQDEIVAKSLKIEKEGKKEIKKLRGTVEGRVTKASEQIFRSVLRELKKE